MIPLSPIKKGAAIAATLVAAAQICLAAETPYKAEILISGPGELKTESGDSELQLTKPSWKKKSEWGRYDLVIAPAPVGEWRRVEVFVTSPSEQTIILSLQAERKKGAGVFFDTVEVDGKPILNGDFSNGFQYWIRYSDNKNDYPFIVESDRLPHTAPACAYTTYKNAIQTCFKIPANKRVKVALSCRSVKHGKDKLPPFSLDISSAAAQASAKGKKAAIKDSDLRLPDEIRGIKLKSPETPLLLSNGKSAEIKLDDDTFGKFLYVLHAYVGNSKGRVYAGKVVVRYANGTFQTFNAISGDSIGKFSEETASQTEVVKAAGGFFYLAQYRLKENRGRVKSVEFSSNRGRTYAVLASTLDTQNVILGKTFSPSEKEWKPYDIGDMQISKGSILDLSRGRKQFDIEKNGRLTINKNGGFAFENFPGENVVLHSSMTTINDMRGDWGNDVEKAKRNIDEYVEKFKRGGYQMIRLAGVTNIPLLLNTDEKTREKLADTADYAIAALKKNGIYINLTMPSYNIGLPNFYWDDRDAVKFKLFTMSPDAAESWGKVVRKILNRKNRYTGFKLKDEKAIASLEYVNEIELGPERAFWNTPWSRPYGEKIFRKWLSEKYTDIAALNKAWKSRYKSFGEITWKDFPGKLDWSLFLRECGRKFGSFCENLFKEEGYGGLVMQFNVMGNYTFGNLRAEYSDFVGMNTYFCHPSDFYNIGSKCLQISSIPGLAAYWRGISATRITGRPMIMTEFKHVFWNRHQYEGGLVFPAYSALQNFSALESFVRQKDDKITILEPFLIGNNPICRASEILSYCFFARRDVKESEHLVELRIDEDFISKNPNAAYAPNSEQTKIALLTGFAVDYPDAKKRAALKDVKPRTPDIVISPVGYSSIESHDWFTKVNEGKDAKFDLKKFTEELREKKILPPGNITDVDKGIFQSDTGQITMMRDRCLMKVVTPKSEAVAMLAGDAEKLGALEVESLSENATVAVCAMDGKNVADSSSMVFIFSTRAINSGMMLSFDQTTLFNKGKLPILMKLGKLKASLKVEKGAKYSIYPLCINGIRREKIPCQNRDGVLEISIDLAALPNGPTPLFEIAKE